MRNSVLLIFSWGVFGIVSSVYDENLCWPQDTCERCLAASLECAWCTDKTYDNHYRCFPKAELLERGCNETTIYENEPASNILQDTPLKDYETVNDQAVQIQPQKVYLKLVKPQTQRLKMSYRPARNNPLDLYVLMDLTWTMRDDRETLIALGSELTKTLVNLTPNHQMGFGSFADKPVMPMILPNRKENPCAAERVVCAPTYGFKHHLKLTDNINTFIRSVNSSEITGNLDNLEGGLEALMQVLVCPEEIGWRPEARKVVILVTDGFMHFAGDALLAGITKPNDKQCHLDANGDYLGSLEFDYPSLEEIAREVLKRKVNVIFAVTADVVSTYQSLSTTMMGNTNVEILSTDSSNILELIKKSYATILQRTQFTDDSPAFIRIDYETDCGGQFRSLRKRNYCNGLEMGTTVDFYINLTLTDYPTDGVYNRKIRIEESSLNAVMEIEVEIQKPCPCVEEPGPKIGYCNDHGYLSCGMCVCEEGWTGTLCACPTDPLNATTNDFIENLCRPPDQFSEVLGPVCSNHGECDCGTCNCFPGWSGKFCECPECEIACYSELADCICGMCVCKYGKTGSRCNCKEEPEKCVAPNGEICSDQGVCTCGKCQCNSKYRGKYCEFDGNQENKLCSFYEPCVTCHIEQKMGHETCANLSDICADVDRNALHHFQFVEELAVLDSEPKCLVRLQTDYGEICDHYFTYEVSADTNTLLTIQVSKCEPTNLVALFGGITALTFLIGIIILLFFYCLIKQKDKREYERFVQQTSTAFENAEMQNPIYKNPVKTYTVPDSLQEDKNANPFK